MKHRNRFFALFALLALMLSAAGFNPAYAATVTKLADTNDGVCDINDCSLREAIAGAAAGAAIDFSPVLEGETIILGSTLTLTKNVTIDGSTLALPIAISGNNSVRVFTVNSGVNANLNNLKIVNGKTSGGGGGIYNAGTLTLSNSTLSGNTTLSGSYGGGLNNNGGTATVLASTFEGNSAPGGYGGGINNAAGSAMTIYNSTFSGNSADHGGGLRNAGASITLVHSTFVGNSASFGGGIRNLTGTLNYRNTIIADNTGADCSSIGAINTANSLVRDGSCFPAISGDPKLGALADNGGPTKTFALLPGSPADDAANDACLTDPLLGVDQRGVTRPQTGESGASRCDIGAFERRMVKVGYRSLVVENGRAFTRTFNGGWFLEGSTVEVGPQLTQPAGYAFLGWYSDQNVTYQPGDTFVITKDIVLMASFTSDVTPPVVTAFEAVTPSDTPNISIPTFTATDNLVVRGYLITESGAPPPASDPGWSSVIPTVYTVGGPGSYTLYPWVKDAADIVSSAVDPAVVTVKADQTALSITGPASVTFGSTGTITTSGGSGTGAISYSAGSSTGCAVNASGVISVSDAGGSCSVTATKAADDNYNAATSAARAVTLNKAGQTITFGTAPSLVVGGTGTVSATGGASTNPVTFASQTTGVCTINGATVTGISAGTCTIAANQIGNGNYEAAAQATQNISVGKGTQATLSITGPASVTFGSTGTITTSGGSGTGAISYSAGSSTGCAVNASGVISVSDAGGSCSVTATKAADDNYNAATSAARAVTLNKAGQTITFGTAPSLVVGGTGTVSATGGASTNPVTFASQTTGVCTISGSTVTGITVGTCTIAANQIGNGNYEAAAQATQNISVGKGTQATLSVTGPSSVTYGSTGAITTSGGSGTGAISYSAGSSTGCAVNASGVISVSDAGGSCSVTATKAADDNYNAATSAARAVTLNKAGQTITFGTTPSLVVGGTGTVSATGGAPTNPVTFASQTTGVCTISGATVTGISAGTCTIAANQIGNGNYEAAAQATQNIIVSPPKPIHVKAGATGANDGTSWTNAFAKLADALAAAKRGNEIWVAKGIYYPDEGTGRANGDGNASFAIPDGVQLYGGFAGSESAVGDRDWFVNRVVLSGDIGQDDTDTDGNRITESWSQIQGSNSRHVVTTGAVDSSTALDGFIITGGDGGASNTGGGLYNDGGSPTLTNVQFLGNRGSYGGGMESSGSPDLANVLFWGNRAEQQGGGLYLSGGNAVVTNASFNGNSAGSGAGAGGGMAIQAGSPAIRNAILWGDVNGELYVAGGTSPTFAYSLIKGCGGSAAWNATACGNTDGGGNKDADPLFVNAAKGELHLSSALSPAYKSGGVALAQAANLATDLQGANRFQTVGKVDMGAYEQLLSTTTTATGTTGSDVVIVQRTTLTVSAGDGDDVIYNAIGKQTMTGGAGADRFVYTSITERTDIIEDFSGNFGATPQGDRLDLSQLMSSLGCKVSAGCSPLATGSYVSFQDATGGVYVMIDIDGSGPLTSKTQLLFLKSVTAAQINSAGNFVF